MGFGIKELVIILVIVILLFGTKRLKNIGSDLGGALKGFKKSMSEEDDDEHTKSVNKDEQATIDGEAENISREKDKHNH